MLKYLLVVTLVTLFFCGAASAEWMRVGGTHKYVGYADMATIAPTGRTVTLWTLKHFKVDQRMPQGTYRSVRIKNTSIAKGTGVDPCGARNIQPSGEGEPVTVGEGNEGMVTGDSRQ